MKRTLPNDPMNQPAAPVQQGPGGDFDTYASNTDFFRKVAHPHFPEPNTGPHVPVWLTPKLAQQILQAHGGTGHAIPHQNIDLQRLDR